uniref:Uncharacterized protein n=1 Tax=Rhizophora mucronata TaxID=61149 RepID=A0A2P2LIJ7_RHIMU
MEKTQNDKRSSKLVIEEWNGSSSTKLCKTATITATSLLSLSIQRLILFLYCHFPFYFPLKYLPFFFSKIRNFL